MSFTDMCGAAVTAYTHSAKRFLSASVPLCVSVQLIACPTAFVYFCHYGVRNTTGCDRIRFGSRSVYCVSLFH